MNTNLKSFQYTTIKDYHKEKLDKRVKEMEKRGYELVAKRSIFNGINRVVHYAKLKNARD